jgi:signal transduction histidine kinase
MISFMRYPKFLALLAVCGLLACTTAIGQSASADSLDQAIRARTKNDTVKVNWMVSLATMLVYSNPTKALHIVDDVLPMAEGLHYTKGILDGYNIKTSLFIIQGNFQQGLGICKRYLEVAEQFDDKAGVMAANNRIGIIYSQNSDYPQALQYMLAALQIAESMNDKKRMAASNQNIGNVYNDMEDYAKALEYYKKSISITESIIPKTIVPPSLYNNIGIELIHQKKYDSAVLYLQIGKAISQQTGNQRSLAGALTNLADASQHLGNYDNAYQYAIQALSISRILGDKRAIANNYINIGLAIQYLSDSALRAQGISPQDRYPLAINTLDSAIHIATEIGDLVTRQQAYKCKSEIAERSQNYPLAISSLLLYTQLHDTILNNNNQKGVERKLAQYEFDKKEAEIKLEQQITESKLKEQELLALEGQQQLRINQNELALSNRDRDFQKLSLIKQQADLLKERQDKENIEQLGAQKDRINALQAAGQRRFRYGLIAGLLLIATIGALIYRQSSIRKTANQRLTTINAQLEEANKVKARLFGILTHDLRSPVASLINFLHLQKDEPGMLTPEVAERHRHKMVQSAEDLLTTIEDLLLWSKGQMKNFKPQIKVVSASELFDEIKSLYPSLGTIQLDFDVDESMQIRTDENYLKTIIRNLTSNSMKAVSGMPKGKIVWKAWENVGSKFLSISDNGPGISPSQQRVLFDENASIGARNGFGLSLIRDFALAIECKLSVVSKPGEGSIITLQVG